MSLFWRTESSDRFMAAGRSLPGWAVGLSVFGSYISSISFLANPGKAYADNWNAAVFALAMPLAARISVRWFVPFFRQSGEMLGGTEAWIWAGVMQAVLLLAGAGVCVVAILCGMPEGPGQIVRIAVPDHKFSLGNFGPSLADSTFWVVLAYGFVTHVPNFGIDQGYVQRYIVAASDRAAARSVWLGTLMFMPVSLVFFFIGTALFAFYKAQPELLAGSVGAAAKPDAVFPHFIGNELPPGLTGLVIAAICAAAMDSNLNCCATLVLCDCTGGTCGRRRASARVCGCCGFRLSYSVRSARRRRWR